jgi:hypothetical protein
LLPLSSQGRPTKPQPCRCIRLQPHRKASYSQSRANTAAANVRTPSPCIRRRRRRNTDPRIRPWTPIAKPTATAMMVRTAVRLQPPRRGRPPRRAGQEVPADIPRDISLKRVGCAASAHASRTWGVLVRIKPCVRKDRACAQRSDARTNRGKPTPVVTIERIKSGSVGAGGGNAWPGAVAIGVLHKATRRR